MHSFFYVQNDTRHVEPIVYLRLFARPHIAQSCLLPSGENHTLGTRLRAIGNDRDGVVSGRLVYLIRIRKVSEYVAAHLRCIEGLSVADEEQT